MNAKLIFIEGVDRVGKGELAHAIQKATNYKHVVFDRCVFSNMVYNISERVFSDKLNKEYEQLERQLAQTDHLLIYLTCETEELEKRAKFTNHEDVKFDIHKDLFKGFINTTKMNLVQFDTTKMTPMEIAKILIKNEQI